MRPSTLILRFALAVYVLFNKIASQRSNINKDKKIDFRRKEAGIPTLYTCNSFGLKGYKMIFIWRLIGQFVLQLYAIIRRISVALDNNLC